MENNSRLVTLRLTNIQFDTYGTDEENITHVRYEYDKPNEFNAALDFSSVFNYNHEPIASVDTIADLIDRERIIVHVNYAPVSVDHSRRKKGITTSPSGLLLTLPGFEELNLGSSSNSDDEKAEPEEENSFSF